MDSPRSADALDSPSTQRTASITLDLPQPLGPTTPTRSPGTEILVGSTKDLKPASLIWERRNLLFVTSYNWGNQKMPYKTTLGMIILTDLTERRECLAVPKNIWKPSQTQPLQGITISIWRSQSLLAFVLRPDSRILLL